MKKLLSLALCVILMFTMLPQNSLAADESITVTVKFDATVVAADMDTLYSDLIASYIIDEETTNLPSDITVSVPKGATVQEILTAAREKNGFTAVGIDEGYVTQVGFVGSGILENLVSIPVGNYSSGNIFNSAGWSFYMDGEGLAAGIKDVTVSKDGAVIEGRFGLVTGWDSNWNALHYDEMFLDNYERLSELTEKDVDTSTFSEKEKQKLATEKAEARDLLAEIYNEAALNGEITDILLSLHPTFKTSGGMWIGYMEKKGTSFWGTGSSSERLEKALKELESAIAPLPENLLSELYVTTLFGTAEDNLIADFASDKYEYVIKDYTKDNFLPKFMKWKSVAVAENATVSVALNGESISSSKLSDNWEQYSDLVWEDRICNKLTFRVTPPEGSVLSETVYTVKIYPELSETQKEALEKEARDEKLNALLQNIAKAYTEKTSYWEVMDMGAYKKYAPETEILLPDHALQGFVNASINTVAESDTEKEIVKAILALTAQGKDASRLYKVNNNTQIDAVKKLGGKTHSTSVWSAPYTLAVYNRNEFTNRAKELHLVDGLLASQGNNGAWDEYGTIDTTANAITGLAFYQNDENSQVKAKVTEAIDKALAYLSLQQNEDGSFSDSWAGRNSNSTAMVAIALAAAGVDVENDSRFIKGGNTIIDGLLSFALEDNSGFGYTDNVNVSDYSTEQAFRALIALAGAIKEEKAYNVYDFNGIPTSPARATDGYTGGSAPSAPQGKEISVSFTIKADNGYWLNSYTVNLPGDGATVYHAFVKGCDANNIKYQGADDGYVSSISKGNETLAEFSAGQNSGWLYKLNGVAPLLGIRECKIEDGDSIEFFYTKDYKKESGLGSWNNAETEKTDEEHTDEIASDNEIQETLFADVTKEDWYYESVKYVYENKLMQGTGNGFEPESKMTRAMLVTVLYRMANPENTENTHSFSDVPEGRWYSDAVAWASSNEIVSGVGENRFAPDEDITREQMALIIYRFAKHLGVDVTDASNLEGFTDMKDISDWALDAIKWANSASLINGTTEAVLSPKGTATRAQVATILMRFCENIAK